MVVGGDNLFEFDLNRMVKILKEKNSSVIVLYDLKDPKLLENKFGTVVIDENQRITNFEEKPEHPKSSLAATLCYLFTKEDVKELEESIGKIDNAGNFIEHLYTKKTVYAIPYEEAWIDIGCHEEYKEANKIYSSNI